jgi:hypothetical protein
MRNKVYRIRIFFILKLYYLILILHEVRQNILTLKPINLNSPVMKSIKTFTVFVFFSLIFSHLHSQEFETRLLQEANQINTKDFQKHMAVLAHDSLEGRNTSSRGYTIAANYIVDNLEKSGIQPAGQSNSYFQSVPLKKYTFKNNAPQLSVLSGQKTFHGAYGKNFTSFTPIKYPAVNETQNIVCVGKGIIYPQLNINDYANVDVTGKTVIIEPSRPKYLQNEPKSANYELKLIENAIEQGASGVLFVNKIGILQKLILKHIHAFFSEPVYAVEGMERENPVLGFDSKLVAFANRRFVKKIFKAEDRNLRKYLKNIKKGIPASFEMKSTLNLKYETESEKAHCKNVVALIPGSDPQLRDEYIIISAHLDHVGIGRAIKNDSIYNGAWDNASGSAGILELAKMLIESSVKFKRSIVFLWLTAEEKGLLGSHYFAHYPTIPKEKIVANINLDMMGGFFEAKDIIPMGYRMSNISEAIDFATNTLNLSVNDSATQIEQYFENSDHFSFIQQGIPSVFIWRGLDAKDPDINGYETYKKWERKVLHSPFDDLSQDFKNKAFETALKINFLTIAYLANEIESVEWNEESKMYKKYVMNNKMVVQ